MKQNFFNYLPPEITVNILSRLPVRAVAISKCVCKSWLDLLETDYFVDSHLAKSISTMAVLMRDRKSNSNWFEIFELEDELDRRYNLLTKFEFPHQVSIRGSANGLLFLHKLVTLPDTLYICNPITRDYAEICRLEEDSYYRFGVSKISGQYKVVAINSESECRVYTLGTDSWRLAKLAPLLIRRVSPPLNLVFQQLLRPAPRGELCVLKDCLCFHTWIDEIVIWLMLDNGVEKRWRKEYVVKHGRCVYGYCLDLLYPIKVFGNGDILMLWEGEFLFCYYSEIKAFQRIVDAPRDFIDQVLLTPSFLSLEGLGMENVLSF